MLHKCPKSHSSPSTNVFCLRCLRVRRWFIVGPQLRTQHRHRAVHGSDEHCGRVSEKIADANRDLCKEPQPLWWKSKEQRAQAVDHGHVQLSGTRTGTTRHCLDMVAELAPLSTGSEGVGTRDFSIDFLLEHTREKRMRTKKREQKTPVQWPQEWRSVLCYPSHNPFISASWILDLLSSPPLDDEEPVEHSVSPKSPACFLDPVGTLE